MDQTLAPVSPVGLSSKRCLEKPLVLKEKVLSWSGVSDSAQAFARKHDCDLTDYASPQSHYEIKDNHGNVIARHKGEFPSLPSK